MNKCERCYSYAINHHCHGRDGSDSDLCDVCYWRKRAETVSDQPVGEVPEVLITALRQYRHSYGSEELIAGYEYDETNRIVAALQARAVVMPDRKTKEDYTCYIDEFADEAAHIANSALDEVARLNGKGGA